VHYIEQRIGQLDKSLSREKEVQDEMVALGNHPLN